MGRTALAARVGGLLAIGFDGTTIQEAPARVIGGLAGAVLFKRNLKTAAQTKALVEGLQAAAARGAPPLLIALDEEGGSVSRIGGIGTWMPSAMSLGAAHDPELTEAVYRAMGEELAALGVTLDLAPVADVNTDPSNPVIGVRSFGADQARVSDQVCAAVRGLHASGIAATVKHFPGHGDAHVDSHLDLPVIAHSLDRMRAVDIVPFAAAIKSGVDVVMTAHIWFSALDPLRVPATMSQRIVGGLLRDELGYDGVVCTDCVQMRAVADAFAPEEAAVRAIAAGADLVLISRSLDAARAARKGLADAVLDGTLAETAVARSLDRVERLRRRPRPKHVMPLAQIGSVERRLTAARAAQRGVTLIRDPHRVLPLSIGADSPLLVARFGGAATTTAENGSAPAAPIAPGLRARFSRVREVATGADLDDAEALSILSAARDADAVVCVTYRATQHASQARIVTELARLRKPLIVIAAREPYDADALPHDVAVIAAFGDDPAAMAAAGAVVMGSGAAGGSLPVTLASAAR